MTEFVYVAASFPSGPCKVGRAINPDTRALDLQCGNPFKIRIWARCKTTESKALERAVHKKLSKQLMSGEWFAVTTAEAVAAIHDVLAGFVVKPNRASELMFVEIDRAKYNAYQRDYKKAVKLGLSVKAYRDKKASE